MKNSKKSPQLMEISDLPRRSSKDFDHKKLMTIITTKNPKNSPGLRSPLKTPLKSPASALKADVIIFLKNPQKLVSSDENDENDLKTEELGNNYVMDEKETRILHFLEEESVLMANPKEKQFEYYENVKKNAFLFFSAVDRSRSECNKRFSLDSSTLLNKRRASLPRLMKNDSSTSENESSPEVASLSAQKKGDFSNADGEIDDCPRKLEFGFGKKKSKFNKEKNEKTQIQEKCEKSQFHYKSMEEREKSDGSLQKKREISEKSSVKSSDEESDEDSNISSERKSES